MTGRARLKRIDDLVEERVLLDVAGIDAALREMASAILAQHPDPARLVLVGIRTGGVFLGERLRRTIGERLGCEISFGVMDITLYRDDVFVGLPRPEVGSTELPCALDGKDVVLVDDVLFTGRTIRAALDELMDYGRPQRIQLAVLVDRGCRELPIQADYAGLAVPTTREQTVRVSVHESGSEAVDRVALFRKLPR